MSEVDFGFPSPGAIEAEILAADRDNDAADAAKGEATDPYDEAVAASTEDFLKEPAKVEPEEAIVEPAPVQKKMRKVKRLKTVTILIEKREKHLPYETLSHNGNNLKVDCGKAQKIPAKYYEVLRLAEQHIPRYSRNEVTGEMEKEVIIKRPIPYSVEEREWERFEREEGYTLGPFEQWDEE